MKAGTFIHCCLGPYFPLMSGNNAVYCGKPNAISREIIGSVQTLKGQKYFVDIVGIKSSTIVRDRENTSIIFHGGINIDRGIVTLSGVFPGIADEIGEGNGQQVFISHGAQVFFKRDVNGTVWLIVTQGLDYFFGNFGEIHLLDFHFITCDA